MSCSALKTGDHSPNFEHWCLVLSVELVWYIQSSQLQPALLTNDSDIAILLHKQQYQLSEFSFLCTWQLWQLFLEKYTGWLYGLRKATLLTVYPMIAASWSGSVTMVSWNIMSWNYIQSTTPPYRMAFRTTGLVVEILPLYVHGIGVFFSLLKLWGI